MCGLNVERHGAQNVISLLSTKSSNTLLMRKVLIDGMAVVVSLHLEEGTFSYGDARQQSFICSIASYATPATQPLTPILVFFLITHLHWLS